MSHFFNFDSLAKISSLLIIFISTIVVLYSKNYLRGDKRRSVFLAIIPLLATSLILTFSLDNIFLISIFWMISNLLLVAIMVHKTSWKQSVQSGKMALKNFSIGAFSLLLAVSILYHETNTASLKEILIYHELEQKLMILVCALIIIAALTQSAIYPFHRWLISSLNSPTTASALMHAGLVNGGGMLLARFAPFFFKMPEILNLVFILGIISALIGTLWKLVQSNVKSMLACSTMSQMGFMIAQCGMGLFPAAIAHLFWHGMFKSYLFLSSPGSGQEKRLDLRYPPKFFPFILALICGAIGAATFAKINKIDFALAETTLVLVAVCFIAASQVGLTIMGESPLRNFIPALLVSFIVSALYGFSVTFVEAVISHEFFWPQPLNILHIIATLILFAAWIGYLFSKSLVKQNDKFFLKCYVKILNASQPKASTITSNRNQYNYR